MAVPAWIMDACLFSDLFLRFVLQGPFGVSLVELILRIVLRDNTIRITKVVAQHDVVLPGGRRVSPDICAWDAHSKRVYGIEIQKKDEGADAKRAGGHACAIRGSVTTPGMKLEEAPTVIELYITSEDVYNEGEPVVEMPRVVTPYDPERVSAQGTVVDTGTQILYMSIEAASSYSDAEIGKLAHDLLCIEYENARLDLIREILYRYKETPEGVAEMADMMRELLEKKEEEAREETTVKYVRALMDTSGGTAEKWLAALEVPKDEWQKYLALV